MPDDHDSDRTPDPKLTHALRARYGPATPHEASPDVDWPALHGRIVAAARERLAARRAAPPEWWRYASRWARTAVPVGLAASALLAIGIAVSERRDAAAAGTTGTVGIEEVIASTATETMPADAVLAADQDQFLSALVVAGDTP